MNADAVLREFIYWFDSRYPRGGKALPGVTLWSIAERAREALEPVQTSADTATAKPGRGSAPVDQEPVGGGDKGTV